MRVFAFSRWRGWMAPHSSEPRLRNTHVRSEPFQTSFYVVSKCDTRTRKIPCFGRYLARDFAILSCRISYSSGGSRQNVPLDIRGQLKRFQQSSTRQADTFVCAVSALLEEIFSRFLHEKAASGDSYIVQATIKSSLKCFLCRCGSVQSTFGDSELYLDFDSFGCETIFLY